MTIGERIKQRRLELNLTVDELAKKLGKNRATVYRYESNEIENFPTTTLEPLAKALNTTPAYLMGWESEDEMRSIEQLFLSQKEQVFYAMGSAFSDFEIEHMRKFDSLSRENQTKVVSYTENLLSIQQMEEEQAHLIPQATHERTDIEVTDDMKKHDDDIMDDEAFWNK